MRRHATRDAQAFAYIFAGDANGVNLVTHAQGYTGAADILIDFDNAQASFAASQSSGIFFSAGHLAITTTEIFFNTGFNRSFNQESNIQIGAPGALAPLAFGLIILASTRRRRS